VTYETDFRAGYAKVLDAMARHDSTAHTRRNYHRAEIRLVGHVAARILERRVIRTRIEIRGCPVNTAAYRTADRHHDAAGAVVGALAAILRNAAAELGELIISVSLSNPWFCRSL